MSNKPWYYAIQQERHGPVEASVFEQMVRNGTLAGGTLVWQDGMSGWAALETTALRTLIPTPAIQATPAIVPTSFGSPAGITTSIEPSFSRPVDGVAPWLEKKLSAWGQIGMALALIVLIGMFLGAIIGFAIGVSGDSSSSPVVSIIVSLLVFGLAIFGMVKIWPYLGYPADFKTQPVPASSERAPVEVRFTRTYGAGTAIFGKGTCFFNQDGLVADGYTGASIWIQLGVILAVTVLPLVIFGCGLGILPALLLAYYIGRKQVQKTIPYSSITKLTVNARTIKIEAAGTDPRKLTFTIASNDGERVYREIQRHYPQAVAEYRKWLA